jgi:hypothetical protein
MVEYGQREGDNTFVKKNHTTNSLSLCVCVCVCGVLTMDPDALNRG